MHNCRTTRDRITEILLSSSETGPTELDGCEECRGEFETLKETLRLTSRAIDATTPPKEDWSNYKSSLKLKLLNASTGSALAHHSAQRRENWLRRWLTASIRVPVPVGAAVVLLFAISLIFAVQHSRKTETIQTTSIVKVPVEVPVVQDRVVTRIVYRQIRRQSASRQVSPKPDNAAIAESQSTPVSLTEFKPLDEVKFKIIKGGSPDEK